MKTKLIATLALLGGSTLFAAPRIAIGVEAGPVYGAYGYTAPAPVAVAPGPGYIWVDGFWEYVGPRRVWRPGYWAPPRAAFRGDFRRDFRGREERFRR
jgi:WXXGXW repeat (2 copies)